MKHAYEEIPRRMELLFDDIPDDDALLDELIGLVDMAVMDDEYIWSGRGLPEILPPTQAKRNASKLFGNILFFLAIIVITVAAVSHNMSGSGARNIAGFSIFKVLTESMQSEIPMGSLVLTKQVNARQIQIGDDITYMVSENTSVTHRVVGIIENHENSGERGFETKGIDNHAPDKEVVWARNVVGKVIFHTPRVGTILVAISDNWLLILLPFIGILIFSSLLKFVFSKEARGKGQAGSNLDLTEAAPRFV